MQSIPRHKGAVFPCRYSPAKVSYLCWEIDVGFESVSVIAWDEGRALEVETLVDQRVPSVWTKIGWVTDPRENGSATLGLGPPKNRNGLGSHHGSQSN
jgi:hypothetical protein